MSLKKIGDDANGGGGTIDVLMANLGIAGYVNEYSASQHILPSLAPHLFPDNFNRRGGPRVVMGIPVSYRAGGTASKTSLWNSWTRRSS